VAKRETDTQTGNRAWHEEAPVDERSKEVKYGRVPIRESNGNIVEKVFRGRIWQDTFEILDEAPYPLQNWQLRDIRKVELISEKEYFKALLNGEG